MTDEQHFPDEGMTSFDTEGDEPAAEAASDEDVVDAEIVDDEDEPKT